MKLAALCVKIGPSIPGEANRRAHFFQDFEIIIQTSFGNPDLLSTIGRCAGTFVSNKVVETDETVQ